MKVLRCGCPLDYNAIDLQGCRRDLRQDIAYIEARYQEKYDKLDKEQQYFRRIQSDTWFTKDRKSASAGEEAVEAELLRAEKRERREIQEVYDFWNLMHPGIAQYP